MRLGATPEMSFYVATAVVLVVITVKMARASTTTHDLFFPPRQANQIIDFCRFRADPEFNYKLTDVVGREGKGIAPMVRKLDQNVCYYLGFGFFVPSYSGQPSV